MTIARLSFTILIFLLLCLKFGHSGVKKIKIHVPYYVKHVHHFKKVYVPKVHVIKHEHHHKKEYDHHHHHHDHHHEVYKRVPYKSHKYHHEYTDEYIHDFDDFDKSFHTGGKRRGGGYKSRDGGKEHYIWKDGDTSDYKDDDDSEEEDDYTAYRKNVYLRKISDRRADGTEGKESNEKEKNEGEVLDLTKDKEESSEEESVEEVNEEENNPEEEVEEEEEEQEVEEEEVEEEDQDENEEENEDEAQKKSDTSDVVYITTTSPTAS